MLKKLYWCNFFRKTPRLARDKAILVIFHKIGVGDSSFFPRGFRVKWGVWGGKKFLPQKIVLIIPGTVYEVPEKKLKNGPRASHTAIVNIGGPENFSHDSAPAV